MRIPPARSLALISLDVTRPKDPPSSLGHASLLANLHHHKIDVVSRSWAVNSPSFSFGTVVDFIMQNAMPHRDVALGAFIWNEKAIQSILVELKKNQFPGRIILGGPQVSYVKNGLESYYPLADIFIRGYGESALVRLMQSLHLSPVIKGVHYAGSPDLGLSATVELEDLPSPFLTGVIQPQRFIRWETKRGCPFSCAFCQHRESDVTMKRREFPVSRIMKEIEWITDNPIIQDVAVLDPTFNAGSNYLNVLDKLIEKKFRGKLSLQCRIEMIKKEFLDRVVKLNETANVVLEFGLQTIHVEEQRIIDRANNMRVVDKTLTEVKERGINSEISLIFGLPAQTVTSFKQSIDFCLQHKIPTIAFPLMLLRGTPLYEKKSQLKLVESNEVSSLAIDRIQTDIPHVISSPSFTYEDWREMAKLAEGLQETNNIQQPIQKEESTTFRNVIKGLLNHGIWRQKNTDSHQRLLVKGEQLHPIDARNVR